jgi:glucose uptake protein GlcU
MAIRYLGNSISIILALTAFVMFILGIYTGYKYSENQLPTPKALKLNKNYMILCFASFSLAIFLFEVSNNGFSLDIFWFSLGLMTMLTTLVYINYFISLKTTMFLKSKNTHLPPLLINRLIHYFSKKSSANKNLDGDEKN